jgi:hypothetical protein
MNSTFRVSGHYAGPLSPRRHLQDPGRQRPGHAAPVAAPARTQVARMVLRGRDQQGNSFEVAFSENDFSRSGGALILGRNRNQSQLVVSHDSMSGSACRAVG